MILKDVLKVDFYKLYAYLIHNQLGFTMRPEPFIQNFTILVVLKVGHYNHADTV